MLDGGVSFRQIRHRLQGDRDQVEDDQNDDELTDRARAAIPDRAVMEYLIEAAPQLRGGCRNPRLHADSHWLASVQRFGAYHRSWAFARFPLIARGAAPLRSRHQYVASRGVVECGELAVRAAEPRRRHRLARPLRQPAGPCRPPGPVLA